MTDQEYTAICLLIDESGSMSFIHEATEEAINGFIQKQATSVGRRTLRIMTFQGSFTESLLTEHSVSQDPSLIAPFVLRPRGSTPLLDAMGISIQKFGEELADLPEEDRPAHVVFAIMTDGLENSSHEFFWPQVKAMVEHQQDVYSWQILYLGANQDALSVGRDLGVSRDSSLTYAASSAGVRSSISTMDSYVSAAAMDELPKITEEQRREAVSE
jgi:hypothetical protein